MGDFNGIGPEISLQAALHDDVRAVCRPVLVGSLEVYEYYARRSRMRLTLHEIDHAPSQMPRLCVAVWPVLSFRSPSIHPGIPSVEAGTFAGAAIRTSVELWTSGVAGALVTGPTSKDVMNRAGFRYPGQTEMIAEYAGEKKPTMMLIAGKFRVALATVHLPLARVASTITSELILRKLRAVDSTLRKDLGIRRPAIAILGVNPHAGENGLLGSEERSKLAPALTSARRAGIRVDGPFPADGFFATQSHTRYDAVLAMYHDQGLIPLKMSGFDIGVNFSSGLDIVRTSPDHGTAYALAGKSRANPGSLIAAIRLAVEIVRNRQHGHI
jgi:4-hydroxythreonine-4-phosphate dehydrogenase